MNTGIIIWIIGALACFGFLSAAHDLSDREDSFTDFPLHLVLSALLWPFTLGVTLAFILKEADKKGEK